MTEIILRVRGPLSSTVVRCMPSTSIGDLRKLVNDSLELGEADFDLLWGYPVKKLECDLSESIINHLSTNETITVRLSAGAVNSPHRGILQSLSQNQSRSKSRQSPTSTSPVGRSTSSGLNFGARIASLSSPKGRSPVDKSSSPRIKRSRIQSSASNEEDISIHLLAAVSGGTGKRDKMLRAAFRRAVELQYDTATAQARVSSALSGAYRIVDSATARTLGSGDSTQLVVTFHKGLGSRQGSTITENVDLLSRDRLRAVLQVVLSDTDEAAKETLRPTHMAGCSPRVFWSLVRLYGGESTVSGDAMKELLPAADWTWLATRRRALSEKAKRNLEQQQSAGGKRARTSAGEAGKTVTKEEEGETEIKKEEKVSSVDLQKIAIQQLLQSAAISCGKRLSDIISSDVLSRLKTALTPTSSLKQAPAPDTESNEEGGPLLQLAEMDAEALQSRESSLSFQEADECVHAARCALFPCIWRRVCALCLPSQPSDSSSESQLLSSAAVVRILAGLGIGGPQQLAPWRHNASMLLEESQTELCRLGVCAESLVRAAETAHHLRLAVPWVSVEPHITPLEEEEGEGEGEGEDEQDEETEREELEAEGWTVIAYEADAMAVEALRQKGEGYAHLGKEVVVSVEGDDEGGEDREEVRGRVVAYAPATAEDPMALWKVHLNEGRGKQDLELHELEKAMMHPSLFA
mmetsp:Transcript_36338/g.37009  ORF Transcript_36338/g.37009 Transcript_36338/m.37009 type:complete len:693 (-) Transcript_36338:56-2134(-)